MGKKNQAHHVQQHHDHHDHHDHHEEHSSELRHDIPPISIPQHFSNKLNDPLNFTKKHPLFNIQLQKKGPQFSVIDDKRLQYIKNFAGKLPLTQIRIPSNLPGLVPKVGDLPSNRKLWRPTSSYQRNGIFNVHTHSFNTRAIFPFFFSFLLYGWWGHATFAWYKTKYEDNNELLGNFYDKLNTRFPPPAKIWLRPA